MIHTPVVSLVCTEPMPAPGDRSRLRRAARAAEHAEEPCHVAECAAVEALLRRGDLLGLENVELHDVLRALELAHPRNLRAACGSPRL
jgi:hypothetical protein